jgi:ATP-dependent Clp protease ATP-binding subunit ClpA
VFDRFTDRARQVVVLAQEEARMLNHGYIGTEHILLGLIHEGEGVAAKSLESLNITVEAVRRQVELIIGRGQAAPTGQLPFTPRSKKTLELALREARRLNRDYIGTEHILLGVIREGEGVAVQILQRLGASKSRARDAVMRQLSPPAEAAALQPEEKPSPLFDDRERIALALLIEGHTTRQIAAELGVATVEEIIASIIKKLREAAP